MIVIYSIFLLSIYSSLSFIACALTTVQRHARWVKHPTAIFANPINSEGSKYRGDITEEEAFLWFDEAMVSRRRMIEHSESAQCTHTLTGYAQLKGHAAT